MTARDMTLFIDSDELHNVSEMSSGFALNSTTSAPGAPLQSQDFVNKVAARASHEVAITALYWAPDNPFLTSGKGDAAVIGTPNVGSIAAVGRAAWPRVRFAAPADGIISNDGTIVQTDPWTYGRVIGEQTEVSAATPVNVGTWTATDKLWLVVSELGSGASLTWTLSTASSSGDSETIAIPRAGIYEIDNPGAGSATARLTPTGLTSTRTASFHLIAGSEASI